MKTALATALSVAGVLVAGSAAALVNTQVLSSGGDLSSDVPAALAPTSTSVGSLPPMTAPVVVPASTTQSDDAPQQFAFAVGEAGLVTVQAVDGAVALAGTELAPGWRLVESTPGGFGELRVVLASSSTEITFTVAVVAGQPITDVSSRSLAPPATATGSSVPSSRHADDDDDGYDDHDDDHDDDHERDDDD